MQNFNAYSGLVFAAACACVVTLCYALPPFEIRSASSSHSEAAEQWMRQLQQHESKPQQHESKLQQHESKPQQHEVSYNSMK